MKYCKQSIFIVFFSLCTYTLSKIELNEQITTGIISKMIQQKNGVRIGPEKIKVFEEKYPNETLYTLITTLNLNYLPHSLDDYFTDIATEHEKRSFVYLLIKTFFHQKALSGNKTDAFKLDHHTRCMIRNNSIKS